MQGSGIRHLSAWILTRSCRQIWGCALPASGLLPDSMRVSSALATDPLCLLCSIRRLWRHILMTCRQEDKPGALLWLLQEVIPEGSPTLIFTATRHHVEYLHNLLTREGLKTVCVYGQMDQVLTIALPHAREGISPAVPAPLATVPLTSIAASICTVHLAGVAAIG